MAADAHKNFAYSTVATAPSPATSGTSLVVASGDGTNFPAVPFNATIWPTSSQPTSANAEIVRVTARSTDTLTITRSQEGTSARTVVVGDQISATITAKTLTDIENAVEPLSTSLVRPISYQGLLLPSISASVGTTNNLKVARVIIPKTGTLHDISVFVAVSSGNVSFAVYDTGDSSAGNYTRLATSGAVACGSAAAWQIYDPSLVVTAGTQLLLAISADNTTATFGTESALNGVTNQLPTSFIPVPGGALPKLAGIVATAHPAPTSFTEASLIVSGSGAPIFFIARIT